MTEDNSLSSSLPSAAVTTSAAGDATTSPSARGVVAYFRGAVILIGVIGAVANVLVLYAMVASKQHRKQLLIFNQNVFDLTSCLLLLVITYSVKIRDIYLEGVSGYWLCMTLYSDNFVWCAINGSVINLLSITIERYLKVVYPIWSKKFLRKWVLYSAVAFAWIGPTAYTVALVFTTSGVINGLCYATLIWKSQLAALAHSIWYFMASGTSSHSSSSWFASSLSATGAFWP